MNAAMKRGLRTFVQSFTGIFLATITTSNIVDTKGVPHLSALAAVLMAALWGAFVALLSWTHNYLEDKNVIPTLGRD